MKVFYSKIRRISFIMLFCGILSACASSDSDVFSASGTVQAIERGKDGYTAIFTSSHGQKYNAVISRVNMANSGGYQELAVGDKITVFGDTTRLGDLISIKVNQIKK